MTSRFYHIHHAWSRNYDPPSLRAKSRFSKYEILRIVEEVAPMLMYPPYYEKRLFLQRTEVCAGRFFNDPETQISGPFSLERTCEECDVMAMSWHFHHVPTDDPRWQYNGEIWLDTEETW